MITAIFLILVIAVLGAYIASVATTQHTSATLDLEGAKAYQAAYAGIQWGAFQALRVPACGGTTSFPLPGGLAGFAVTVQFNSFAYTESGLTRNMCRITSTGCNFPIGGNTCPGTQGNGYYVERQIEATIDK